MMLKFDQVIQDVTKFSKKTKKKEYLESGTIPIIDQSKKLIAGYTNDNKKKYKNKIPVIIFGDHTRILKYIDFNFSLGADGTKILTGKNNIDNKYLFYYLKSKEIQDLGYSRHFKLLKKLKFQLHTKKKSDEIVSYFNLFEKLIYLKNQQKEKLDRLNLKLFEQKIKSLKNGDFIYKNNIKHIIKIEYGKSLPESKRLPGKYNVYGSNGIIGNNSSFLFNKKSIIIGRKGSAGKLHYVDKPFFPIDTTYFISNFDKDKIRLKFLLYFFRVSNLESLILPQGVPGLRRNDIYKLQIQLPKLQLQDEIINELENLEFLIYNLEKSISGINKIYGYKLKKTFN